MAKKGELLLRAVLNTTSAQKSLRGLLGTVANENAVSARKAAQLQTTLVRESVKQEQIRARGVAASGLQIERIRTQEAKTLTQLTRAQVLLRREEEKTTKSREVANRPKLSAKAQALYSTRINLPGGTAPLIGRSLEAAGFDLHRRSTLALGSAISGLGTAVEIAKPVIAFLEKSTSQASDFNETVNRTRVLFKESAGEIEEWSKTAVDAMGMTRKEAQDAASEFGNMLRTTTLNSQEHAKASEELVQRASDLASFFNKNNDDVARKIRAGLAGESEPLRELGVFLNEATVQAEAFSMGLGKVPPNAKKVQAAQDALTIAIFKSQQAQKKFGEGSIEAKAALLSVERAEQRVETALKGTKAELTEGEKILARRNLILKQSAIAAGDFAKTSGEAANQQKILTARITELETEIGTQFLPLRKDILVFFNDLAKGAFDSAKAFGAWIDKLKEAQGARDKMAKAQNTPYFYANMPGQIAKNASDVGTQLGRLRVQERLLQEEEYRAKNGEYPAIGVKDSGRGTIQNPVSEKEREMSLGTLGIGKYATPPQLAQARAKVLMQIAEMERKYNSLRAVEKAAAAQSTLDLFLGAEPEKAGKKTPASVKTPTPTGNGFTAGGLYSGAGRLSAQKKADAEARKAQRKQEQEDLKRQRALDKMVRQEQSAQSAFQKTLLRNATEAFKSTTGTLGDVKAGYGAESDINGIVGTLRGQSKALKDAEVNEILRRYGINKKINPKAAEIAKNNAFAIAKQNFDKREEDIDNAKQKAFDRILKEAERQADIAEKSTQDDIREYETGRQNYRDFLDAERETLQYAQDEAMRRGEFSRSRELLQAQFDNITRRLVEAYRDDLQAAGGDANAVQAAELRYNSGMAQARRDNNNAVADNILRGTAGDLRSGAGNAVSQLFRDSVNGNGGTFEALQGSFAALGETAGDAFADYTARSFVSGPLERYFDSLANKLSAGGQDAGYSIMLGANTLANVASLLSQQNSKKKSGGLFGGLLGGIAGFVLGGPMGAAAGFSAGSQLGQGNIIGAGLSILSGVGGGAFSKAGSMRLGGLTLDKSVYAKPRGVPGYALGGFPAPGKRAWGGENGTELMFSDRGAVTALGVGGFADFKPTGRNVVLPTGTSRALVQAAARMTGGAAASSGGKGTGDTYVQFFGDVSESMHLEQIERERDRKLRTAALVG